MLIQAFIGAHAHTAYLPSVNNPIYQHKNKVFLRAPCPGYITLHQTECCYQSQCLKILEIRSLKLFISQIWTVSQSSVQTQKNEILIPNTEHREAEKQVEVSSTVVTACPKQSEHKGFSEFIKNFLTCYVSVKCQFCVQTCFFAFINLDKFLKTFISLATSVEETLQRCKS